MYIGAFKPSYYVDVSPAADTATVVTMNPQSHLVPMLRSFSDYCSSLKGFICRNIDYENSSALDKSTADKLLLSESSQ